MHNNIFLQGKLKQWKCYNFNKCQIWLAGYKSEEQLDKILEYINKYKILNASIIKKIIRLLGEHFGVVIFSNYWTLAVVDYTRGYPIFWRKKNNKLFISPQASLLKGKRIDQEQLIAFRMSGYTIGEGTLWKEVNSLLAGGYLYSNNKNIIFTERYFTYIPRQVKNLGYKKLQQRLVVEINKLIKKLILDAKGKTIIVPLSAGLDSRLIVSGLKKEKYENVKCFSYGIKNNFEATASKKIANVLGYDWTFVEISHIGIKKFYNSKTYKKYLTYTVDGAAVSTIQGLYAISYLKKNGYICKNSLIINGNSGDFISGGHIPKDILGLFLRKFNSSKILNKIFNIHIEKHYSLWNTLKTFENKKIIKDKLKVQLETSNKNKQKISLFGVLELLEYENRQTKYVVNSQRIYDFFEINWTLPLWNKSFIKYWEKVPLKYKIDQRLYKDTLKKLNYADVWTKKFTFKSYISPKEMIFIRFLFKIIFFFIGKKNWYEFEKKYINYWTENIRGFSSQSYLNFIKNKNIARNYVSLYALIAEKNNLGTNWQKK